MSARLSTIALICGGVLLIAALSVGIASRAAGVTRAADRVNGSPGTCVSYLYAAIERQEVISATPAGCRGLSRGQVNQAVSTAIRMSLKSGSKSARRRQAGVAAASVRALITGPAPAPGSAAPVAGGQPSARDLDGSGSGGPGLGGVSELAAQIGALLAWLAAAASGGWVLVRWLLAGGSPRRRTATAAPPAVILGHVGGGVLGLLLWAAFMLSGWVILAWIALGLLLPLAGFGMSLLALGLPAPARARRAGRASRRARIPALAIVAHGVFAVTVLLLVLMATIGAALKV